MAKLQDTLQRYLSDRIDDGQDTFVLKASVNKAREVTFYIHPEDDEEDAQDFTVAGNDLFPG